jgi:hypothetical protein
MKWTERYPEAASSGSGTPHGERAWNSVCWSAITIGVLADLVWLGPVSAVRVALPVMFVVALFSMCLAGDRRLQWRRFATWALVLPTAAVALVGLWALVQGWAVPIAFGLIGSHPRVVGWARSRVAAKEPGRQVAMTAHGKKSPAQPTPTDVSFGRPNKLSDAALRQCWIASWGLLQRATTFDEVVRIVNYRRTCLDEIGRRNRETFQSWIEAGAPNVDEPARQLPATFASKSSSCD